MRTVWVSATLRQLACCSSCHALFQLANPRLLSGPLFFQPDIACFEFSYPALEFVNEGGLGLGYASPTGLLGFLPGLALFQLANPRLLSGLLFFLPGLACFEFSYPALEFVNEGGLGLGTFANWSAVLLARLACFEFSYPALEFVNEGGLGLGYASPTGLLGFQPYLALLLPVERSLFSSQALPVSSSPIQLLSS